MMIREEDRERMLAGEKEATRKLKTQYPLSERDEVAAAVERTRRLYEKNIERICIEKEEPTETGEQTAASDKTDG